MRKIVALLLYALPCLLHAERYVLEPHYYANNQQSTHFFYTMLSRVAQPAEVLVQTADTVRQMAIKTGDKQLQWYADLFAITFQAEKMKGTPEAERLLIANNQQFENAPYNEVKGIWYFFMANQYYEAQQFAKAFRYYLLANSFMEKAGYTNIPAAVHYLYIFFQLHYKVGDYAAALKFSLLIPQFKYASGLRYAFNYNNIGCTYLKLKQFEQAKKYFELSATKAYETGDTVYTAITSGNYGNTLRQQGLYRQALPYLYTDIRLNQQREPPNTAITCLYAAHCLLQLDSIAQAQQYIQLSRQLQPDWVWSDYGLHYYETNALLYKKMGDFNKATLYQDSLLDLRDQVKDKNNMSLFKDMSLRFKQEEAQQQQQERLMEQQQLALKRNIIIGALLILFGGLFWWFRRRHQLEKSDLLAKKQEADENLRIAQAKLIDYLANLQSAGTAPAQPAGGYPLQGDDTVEASPGNESQVEQKNELPSQPLLTEDHWVHFKNLFLDIYPGFFEKLQLRYPGLSNAEIRLLTVLKTGLPSKEAADLLGISQGSLRKGRYRLRKKYTALLADDEFKEVV